MPRGLEQGPRPGAIASETEPDATILRLVGEDNLVKSYIFEASKTPRLTADEERELGGSIQAGLRAEKELIGFAGNGEGRLELERQTREGKEAQEKLILANPLLVVKAAGKYSGRGTEFLDLIQGGNEGLLKAVKKYDPRRGFRFSTYAVWWIRREIERTLNTDLSVHVPERIYELMPKIKWATDVLRERLERKPTVPELAQFLKNELTPVQISSALSGERVQPVSLEEIGETDETGDFFWQEVLPDAGAQDVLDSINDNEIPRDMVLHGIALLPERLRQIIDLRYYRYLTQEEVAHGFGVSRQRICQSEFRAIKMLRYYLNFGRMPEKVNSG